MHYLYIFLVELINRSYRKRSASTLNLLNEHGIEMSPLSKEEEEKLEIINITTESAPTLSSLRSRYVL